MDDDFGIIILLSTVVCGIALLGYQWYKRNQKHVIETQGNPSAGQTSRALTLPASPAINNGEAVALNLPALTLNPPREQNKLEGRGDSTTVEHNIAEEHGSPIPESPVFMDGGELYGNENPLTSTHTSKQTKTQILSTPTAINNGEAVALNLPALTLNPPIEQNKLEGRGDSTTVEQNIAEEHGSPIPESPVLMDGGELDGNANPLISTLYTIHTSKQTKTQILSTPTAINNGEAVALNMPALTLNPPTEQNKLEGRGDSTTAEQNIAEEHGSSIPESPGFMDGGESDGNENPLTTTLYTIHTCTQTNTQIISTPTETKKSRPKLSPEAMNKIRDVESKFFKGLEKKANLNANELSRLDQIVMGGNSSASFLEILHKMREIGYLEIGHYKATFMNILQKANIVVDDSVQEHLELLDDNIQIIISEDLKRSKRKFEYDIVMIFSDDDHSKAVDFSSTIEQKFQSLNVKIESLSDMDGNQTEIRSLENIFQCTMFLFVLISSNFKDDDLKRYICETSLLESLQNPKAKWRVVPVWLEKDLKKNKKCPIELRPLKGINFHYVTENKCPRSVESVLKNIKSLIKKGRSEMEPA